MEEQLEKFFKCEKTFSFVYIGQSKTGKTTNVVDFLTSRNYRYLRPEYEIIQNHRHLIEIVDLFMTTKSANLNQKVLFFDDVEIIISQDRSANTFIQKLIDSKKCKIICVCGGGEEKRVSDMIKNDISIRTFMTLSGIFMNTRTKE